MKKLILILGFLIIALSVFSQGQVIDLDNVRFVKKLNDSTLKAGFKCFYLIWGTDTLKLCVDSSVFSMLTVDTLYVNDTASIKILYVDSTATFGGDIKTDRWLSQNSNTFIGMGVVGAGNLSHGSGSEGYLNSFYGHQSGYANTTGYSNTFIGYRTGYKNTTGFKNDFICVSAGYENISGNYNSFFGNASGQKNTTGDFNVFFGHYSGHNNTIGNQNVAIGQTAGAYQNDGSTPLETPEFSIYLGSISKSGSDPAGGEDVITNEIVIGYSAIGNGSNTITLGNSSITDTYINGNTTIGQGTAGIDYTITFDGEDNDGIITWQEDEDNFDMSCGLSLNAGNSIKGFSIIGTLTGNSDDSISTQKAVKTYIDAQIVGIDFWDRTGNYTYLQTSTDSVGLGTATPTEKLDVVGNITASGFINADDSLTSGGSVTIGNRLAGSSTGTNSVAIGNNVIASSDYSFAIGDEASATNNFSVAIGESVTASGQYSFSFGAETQAIGTASFAIGDSPIAQGNNSFAINKETFAKGVNSFSGGFKTKSTSVNEFAIGRYNDTSATNPNSWVLTDQLFVVGNGDGSGADSLRNALAILKNGNIFIDTNLYVGDSLIVGGISDFTGNATFDANITIGDTIFANRSIYLADSQMFYYPEVVPEQTTLIIGNGGNNITSVAKNVVLLGIGAGYSLTDGKQNVLIGYNSGYNITTAISSIGIGTQTLYNITTGNKNIAIGNNAMYACDVDVVYNVAIGGGALGTVNGSYNTAIGPDVFKGADSCNAGIGFGAGKNSTGNYNTFIGYYSGYNNAVGDSNVFIGSNSGVNEIGSSKLYIDNSPTATPLIYGDFSTNYLTINGNFFADTIGAYGNCIPAYIDTMSGCSPTVFKTGLKTDNIYANSSNGLKLYDDGGNGIFVKDGGYVGIGTITPNASLEVKGAKPAGNIGGFQSGMLHVTGSGTAEFSNSVITGHSAYNTNTQLWYFGSVSDGNNDIGAINRQDGDVGFYTNNTLRMNIDATGDVAIGLSIDEVTPTFSIVGDADNDAPDVSETLQLVLTPNGDPTLATWGWTSTQSAGYTFDNTITITGNLNINDIIFDNGATIDNIRTNNLTITEDTILHDGISQFNGDVDMFQADGTTSLYWHEYNISAFSTSTGASGATLTAPSANTLGGYQLDINTEQLYYTSHIEADWDGTTDILLDVWWEVNEAAAADGTVDLQAIFYYKGSHEFTNKTQTLEVAETITGNKTQFTQHKTTFIINFDEGGNVVDALDIISFILNLETDTSECDDIIINYAELKYQTTKPAPETN